MGILDNLRNSLSKRQAMLGREPNAGNIPQLRPAVMPNIPNMPNLQSIGGIPGLQNIDFSNLPMGMDFSNFDPRAINANPTGFRDMIEQAQNQELLAQQNTYNLKPVTQVGPLKRAFQVGRSKSRCLMLSQWQT